MSAIAKFLATPPDRFSTTLSGAISNSAVSIPVNSVSGLPTEGVGVIFSKDSTGAILTATIEFIHWTNISGSNLTLSDTGDRGLAGSTSGAQAHSSGDYFEVWQCSHYYNTVRAGAVVEHGTDGKHSVALGQDLDLGTHKLKNVVDPASAQDGATMAYVQSMHPVGSVYLTVVSTNPATLIGFGTWSQVAQGQMLVGYKDGDADFGTVMGTGGSKTATIATTNLPDHVHTGTVASGGVDHTHTYSGTTSDQNQTHTHGNIWSTSGSNTYLFGAGGQNNGTIQSGNASQGHTHTYSGTSAGASAYAHTHTFSTSTTTGANATPLAIINPYYVIYVWRRTA